MIKKARRKTVSLRGSLSGAWIFRDEEFELILIWKNLDFRFWSFKDLEIL